jgi:hypothetical protein
MYARAMRLWLNICPRISSSRALAFLYQGSLKEYNRTEETHVSHLVVLGFDDLFKADEVLLALRKLQQQHLIDEALQS